MQPKIITEIFKRLNATIKNPTTELYYSSNFELLISVILSARTTDKTVNQITSQLFKVANTPQKILDLGITKLKKYIKSSGFFNAKAQNILQTCQILVDKFGSQIPKDRTNLESLPGVGRKTANVILNIAFGKPTIAVDTHVFRVSRRLRLAKGKNPEEVEQELLKIIPKKYGKIAGSLLLLHGRYTCNSRKPKCEICVLKQWCGFFKI